MLLCCIWNSAASWSFSQSHYFYHRESLAFCKGFIRLEVHWSHISFLPPHLNISFLYSTTVFENHFKMVSIHHCDWSWLRYFFADQSMTFDLCCAVKTTLSKLKNLWYLLSEKVFCDAQQWRHSTKKVKSHSLLGKKINVAHFTRIIKWDFFKVI